MSFTTCSSCDYIWGDLNPIISKHHSNVNTLPSLGLGPPPYPPPLTPVLSNSLSNPSSTDINHPDEPLVTFLGSMTSSGLSSTFSPSHPALLSPELYISEVTEFLRSCTLNMEYLLSSFIKFGCYNQKFLAAVVRWPRNKIKDFLKSAVVHASKMELLVLKKYFKTYFIGKSDVKEVLSWGNKAICLYGLSWMFCMKENEQQEVFICVLPLM